jgi:hypothetical protein
MSGAGLESAGMSGSTTGAIIADTDIQFSESFEVEGREIHKQACKLEGVVSKVRDSSYSSGRGNDWFKVTSRQRETLAIVGFTLDGKKSTVPISAGRGAQTWHRTSKVNPLRFALSDDSFPWRNLYIDHHRLGCMSRRHCMPKRKMFGCYRKSGKHFER